MTKLLIIEDEPAMRANLQEALTLEGFQVLAVSNGREGLALAAKELPELILCDILMPGMDGYAVLEALRRNSATATIPFIFLTAKGERSDLRNGMNLGADDYLIKPVPLAELVAAIRARIERHRLGRAEFKAEFKSPIPLESLGLSPREAEVLFWVAQGKTNAEIGLILDISATTVKKHLEHIFQKSGTENRTSASLIAIETLNRVPPPAPAPARPAS